MGIDLQILDQTTKLVKSEKKEPKYEPRMNGNHHKAGQAWKLEAP